MKMFVKSTRFKQDSVSTTFVPDCSSRTIVWAENNAKTFFNYFANYFFLARVHAVSI